MDKVMDLTALINAENLYSVDEENSSESENDEDTCDNTDAGRSGLGCMQKKAQRLQNEVCTRWNSSLEMIESLLHMRAEIAIALKSVGKYDQCLRVQEWVLLEELAAFLKTFRGLTELVSTKTTSLSLFPLLRAEVTDAYTANSTDDDDLKTIKSVIKRNLDKLTFAFDTQCQDGNVVGSVNTSTLTVIRRRHGRHALCSHSRLYRFSASGR